MEMNEMIGFIIFLFIGPTLGFGAGYALSQQRAARELARLRDLVPEAWLLRRAAAFVGGYGLAVRRQPGAEGAAEMAQQLRALAASIEAAEEEDRC